MGSIAPESKPTKMDSDAVQYECNRETDHNMAQLAEHDQKNQSLMPSTK
jgi:hypothetical protein